MEYKAKISINGKEKTVNIASMSVSGDQVDEFNPEKTTCLVFRRATIGGFTLYWATWNASYKSWNCCCKGKGLNNCGNAKILDIFHDE